MSANRRSKNTPPDGLPIYRILTGPDDAAFCHRVSEALALGYTLYGSPAVTFNGKDIIVAQAIILAFDSRRNREVKEMNPYTACRPNLTIERDAEHRQP